MPLISVVGRGKPSVKILIVCMYIILTIGAITMVYPFLLMLGMSVTSEVDKNELRIIPKYIFDDTALYYKYLDMKYCGDIKRYNEQFYTNYYKFNEIKPPQVNITSEEVKNKIKDYEEFKKGLPYCYKVAGFTELRTAGRPTIGKVQRMYQDMLKKKFNNDISLYNKAYIEENDNFQLITPPREYIWLRTFQYDSSIKMKEWIEFKENLDSRYTYPVSGNGLWWSFLKTKYDSDINKLNKKYNTNYKDFNEIKLSRVLPNTSIKSEWEEFIREKIPFRFIRFTKEANDEYRRFLITKYKNNINLLNKIYQAGFKYKSFYEINLPDTTGIIEGATVGDLNEFVRHFLSLKNVYTETTENLYEKYLKEKYKDIENLNKSYKTDYKSFSDILPPYAEKDWIEVKTNSSDLRLYFLTKNYHEVIDYILLHGRAILNTLFYCLIMVLTVLTVNPFCAYVLSRFNLSYSYKILLFLLATMAFPYEVSMIPNFILLRKFGMLNTFYALILPGLANGFSIFILKGFFDSLPKELFEAAKIDGLSEMRIYWQVVLPLTKPVMAYLALGAYSAAYGAFMYALIVCQNPQMWTIMVWLYEMQNWAPSFLIMAALVLAALPTLLVFVFFQNIIIKGIILPVEQ